MAEFSRAGPAEYAETHTDKHLFMHIAIHFAMQMCVLQVQYRYLHARVERSRV